jgi:hypothetical protein
MMNRRLFSYWARMFLLRPSHSVRSHLEWQLLSAQMRNPDQCHGKGIQYRLERMLSGRPGRGIHFQICTAIHIVMALRWSHVGRFGVSGRHLSEA